jgi:poly(hydroxyalkanoate) depolymerase family esterase
MNDHMLTGMREAMSLLQKDGPIAATAKIQQTLQGLMPTGAWFGDTEAPGTADHTDQAPTARTEPAAMLGNLVPDLLASLGIEAPFIGTSTAPHTETAGDEPLHTAGKFLSGTFTNPAGTRTYKLYVPSTYQGQALPLVVMLHGSGQTPDDFAAGTRMNQIAETEPCLVLYPVQSTSANGTRSWNWFNATDQQRDQGEPSLIAGMTREIIATYGVDEQRVYCAGLSAGGAMAAIMAVTYPELFAAIGIHSGLPYAAANDFLSAFSAMNGTGKPVGGGHLEGMPVIVFHGDRDDTVHPRNSDHIITQSLPHQSMARHKKGQVSAGHGYTRTVHEGPDGQLVAEQWMVHGAGHAWSGGSPSGSFTDDRGPDASQEMMRFFAAHSKPAP